MSWLHLSLLTALAVAIRDVTVRKLSEKHDAMEIAAIELLGATPLFFVALFFIEVPELDRVFWWSFAISFPLNWLAYFFYVTALTLAPLSTTVPLLSFTPAFVILTGYLVLNEHVTIYGLGGILLIVLSSYLLNFNEAKKGFLRPFMAIFTEKGPLLMFLVAFIFSLAGVVGKQAIVHSSPLFFGYLFFFSCNLSMLFGIYICTDVQISTVIRFRKTGLWLGALFFCHIMFHCLAIEGINAAYMISIKRISILFSVFLGWFLFKEKYFKFRGPAAFLMFIGALLIALRG